MVFENSWYQNPYVVGPTIGGIVLAFLIYRFVIKELLANNSAKGDFDLGAAQKSMEDFKSLMHKQRAVVEQEIREVHKGSEEFETNSRKQLPRLKALKTDIQNNMELLEREWEIIDQMEATLTKRLERIELIKQEQKELQGDRA